MNGYKKVYNAERKDNTPYYFPEDVAVYRPYTEVEPPEDENTLVIGFNWITNEWETLSVASAEEVLATQEAIAEIYEMMAGGEA